MSITPISIKITADPSGVEGGVGRAKRSLADFKSSGEQSLGGVGQAAGMLQGKLAAIGGGLSIGLAIGQLVQVQREFDKLNSSLVTVAGGSAAAASEMEWLKQFAKETPFGLAQATAGFVKMKALGLDPTRAALTSFGNTAAAMGKDLGQMIEAVADASTGEFERLKEFGIKAKKEGDQVKLTFQGVTTSVGNSAAEITKYLEGLGNNQFAGAMAERANTLDGAIASLGDTWDEMFRTITAGDVGSTITDSVRMAEGAVTDLTAIIKALDGAAAGSAAQTSVLAGAQEALATAFEAIAVLGVNVKYTLVQIGNELGGLAAQAVAVATGQFAQAAAISGMMRADSKKAREDVDATSARILSARSVAALGQPNTYDEPAVLRARATAEKAAADAKAATAKADRDAAAAEAARAAAAKEAAKDAKKAAEAELEWRRKTTLDMVKQWDDQAEAAQKAYDAARAGALKLADATEAAQAATTAGLIDKLAAMRDEIDAIGLTTAQLSELNAVKAEQVIADKEIQLIMLQNADASVVQIQLLEQEINLRKQLVTAMRTKANKEASVDAGKEAAKAADEAEKAWQKASEDIEKSLTDALMRGFESGKDFAANLRDTVANMFKTLVLRPIVSAIVSPVAGAITGSLGLAGAANAGTSALSGAASSAAGSMLFGGASLSAIGSSIGTGFMATLSGQGIGAAASAYSAAGMGGVSAGLQIGAAAPYALAAAAVLAALGAFRTTKTVGGGLTGTLGEGDINSYDLRRKSGYLLGGPDYSIRDTGVATQSAALQAAFLASRTAMVSMADTFNLGADSIRSFTTSIGNDLIHPDTGGMGLKLDGLSPEQVQAKVQAALAAANDAMAAELLGIKTTATETIKRTITETSGVWDDGYQVVTREVEEQITRTSVALRNDLLPWMQRIADAGGPTAATLQAIAEYPNKLLEAAGTSRDALVQTFAQGLMTGDAATAGQTVANQLVASIEQSMLGSAAGQIFDIVNRGIVTPVLDAMLQGQSITEALSQASLDATIAAATAKAQALGAIFNDPKFVQAMNALQAGLGQVLGNVGGALNFTPQYQPPVASVAAATTSSASVGDAVEDLAKKFASAKDSLASTADALAVELLNALGDTAGAAALTRSQYLAGFADLTQAEQDLLAVRYDQNTAARTQIDTLTERKGLESQLLQAQGDTAGLRALELASLAPGNRALQERIWALEDEKTAMEKANTAMATYRAGLTGIIDAASSNTDATFAAFERGIASQRKLAETSKTAAEKLKTEVQGIFDSLQTAVDDLFGSVDSTKAWQAAQGQQYITAALSAARATGALPDGKELSRAIAAATGGLDAQAYSTQAEADFARLVLANELRDLQDISGSQLTEAERQLDAAKSMLIALDDAAQYAQDQLDEARGIKKDTGSMATLLRDFLEAVGNEKKTRDDINSRNLIGTGQAVYNTATNSGANASGQAFTRADAFAAAAPFVTGNANDTLALYSAAQQSGFSLGQLEKIYGLGSGTLDAEVSKIEQALGVTLPRFAVGTNYVPNDMLAVLHQGEAIVPAAYNPAANPGMGGGNSQAELLAELRLLRQQNERLEARLQAIEGHTGQFSDQFDRVSAGGNELAATFLSPQQVEVVA